jgi:hypothetical protein
VNWPPAYSRLAETSMVRTRPSAWWFQAVTAPLTASTAASRWRVAEPTVEKSPPT